MAHELIGREFKGESFTASSEIAAEYSAACDDPNPRYHGTDAIAPPMSAVIYAMSQGLLPVTLAAIPDPSKMMRLLHGEQEIRWHRPVRVGESLSNVAFLKDVTEKGSGELFEITTRSLDSAGAPVVEMTWGLFIRHPGGKKDEAAAKQASETARPVPLFETSWTVAADQSIRYAEASGDRNPIHTHDDIARMAGLKGKILHGLCTMAFAARVVVNRQAGGDPARLKRLRVRFAKPVYPGETLICGGWIVEREPGRTLIGLEVRTQDGVVVLKDASADIA